tara:strand:+ start:62 stop:628 length:567 start_codon:yes stop_codon:yes gene_type:complete
MKYTRNHWNLLNQTNRLLEKAEVPVQAHLTHCNIEKKVYIEAYIPTITAFEGPQGNRLFKADTFSNIEEANKYFSPDVFALGIIQRKDYLLAPHEVKVECYKQNIHPAMYKAPSDEVDVMQDLPNPIEVTRKGRYKTNRYPNGYQGKIDFYLDMAANAMGTGKYNYYDRKVKYFLGRQEEWLLTQKCS